MTATDQRSTTTGTPHGLTAAEVQARIERGQVNAFEAQVGRSYREILRYNLFTVFNFVLFVMLLVLIILGDYITFLFAGFSVITNALIGTVQEINAKRKLTQLADLAPKTVRVWRDGDLTTIPNQQIVQDDLIALAPGDLIVVDGVIETGDNLEIDEAQLTGESEPVPRQMGEHVASGSYCLVGTGAMRATGIGQRSTLNRLIAAAKTYRNPITPTQQRITTIVQFTLAVMFVCLPMLLIAQWLRGETFLEITRSGVVFTTSLVPQGLILIVILSLTIGAVKISRHETLVQRVNAVESLANVTVLCFDKTGTLTENRLVVSEIVPLNPYDVTHVMPMLARYIAGTDHLNSTAAAIDQYLKVQGLSVTATLQRTIPFTSARKWGAVIFADETLILGAPEHVFPVGTVDVAAYTRQGLRVLALGRLQSPPATDGDEDTAYLAAEPIALITIQDRVRPDSPATLAAFMAQGVRPKVISGDNLDTVRAVAASAGMQAEIAYTGDDLAVMRAGEFAEAIQAAHVFARVDPDTKRRIVQGLRDGGDYVAMVGDGVNDVPALKAANLAVAMNDGAQVSKDIADIVLLNNAMSTLPLAFAEGTETTQTLHGTTKMFLAKDMFNTLVFLFTLLMGLPFPITPIQISWASFATTNISGGLIALGLLRPAPIKNFRDDVLDYFVIAGVTGGVGLAFANLVVFTYTDRETARHAMTLSFMLYQLTILWHMGGIDPLRPRTLISNPLVIAFSVLLSILTIGAALLFPATFEFQLPPWEIVGFVLVVHALLMVLVSVGLRNRGLLHRFYTLTWR